MSTIGRLFDHGCRRVRLPQWNAAAYLQLEEVEGKLGCWCTLVDPHSEKALIACAVAEGRTEEDERAAIARRARVLTWDVDCDAFQAAGRSPIKYPPTDS